MKNNSILYVLLVFLIIVNGFFIYNYVNSDKLPKFVEPKSHQKFIEEALDFNEEQKQQMAALEASHRKELKKLGDDVKFLKDQLFSKISGETLTAKEIDSLTDLIGKKEAVSNKKILQYFKNIEALCNTEEQREIFKTIIKDAIGKPERRGMPPPGHHPPPPNRAPAHH
ncbi:hypothetical protein PW52_14410 [Tamlana sedimentorum]|uniref:Periplasmic heavy metal sensor n=1 Tax=Neotamlana sedimentorum TaxID=1435349 RepID=A0A0D7W2C9_9FLAO|nr:hypothetical protein [Tamlana sedimentorum]KJD33236.1 hypothetical protein PW52_14410 [Tamlana sedimentorum]